MKASGLSEFLVMGGYGFYVWTSYVVAAIWLGVKKNTRFDWNAESTSAAARPRVPRPAAIHAKRRVRGFIVCRQAA